jgi:hypothetical protein
MYPELFAELLRSGHWTVGDLKKVAGLNLLRVFAKVEKVTASMINGCYVTSPSPRFLIMNLRRTLQCNKYWKIKLE